jgi:hypothetical protein
VRAVKVWRSVLGVENTVIESVDLELDGLDEVLVARGAPNSLELLGAERVECGEPLAIPGQQPAVPYERVPKWIDPERGDGRGLRISEGHHRRRANSGARRGAGRRTIVAGLRRSVIVLRGAGFG